LKTIIVSQGRWHEPKRGETREGIDTRLISMIDNLGLLPAPMPNGLSNPQFFISQIRPEGILLSGGNNIGDEPERDNTERLLLEYARTHGLPALGICRGMQMMNVFLGGSNTEVTGHAGVRHSVSGAMTSEENWSVNSFHNFGIGALASDLRIEAQAFDGGIEAVSHATMPWCGIMWHPEREEALNASDAALFQRVFFDTKDFEKGTA